MGRLSLVPTQQNFHRLRFFSVHRAGAFGVQQTVKLFRHSPQRTSMIYLQRVVIRQRKHWICHCELGLCLYSRTGKYMSSVTLVATARLAHKHISSASAVAERLTGYMLVPSLYLRPKILIQGICSWHYQLPPRMKMVHRPNTVADFKAVCFFQRVRQPNFGLLHRIPPIVVTRAERSQRCR